MRDKLIEMIADYTDTITARELHSAEFDEKFADHLLANGVIVPPCKVGDKVYSCIGREYYVRRIIIKDGMPTTFLLESGLYGQLCVTESDFGSLAFLTKEEAEKALAGRSKE